MPRFNLDEALASGDGDPFARTKAGARPVHPEFAIPVNPARQEGWQHKAGLIGSSVVKGVAGIPDSIIQTPRNVINLGKALYGTQAMLLADALRAGLGIGGGAEGVVGMLDKTGISDTPDNPIPFVEAIPAHPVTTGIDAGLRAATGHGLVQPRTADERVLDWAVQGASGAAAMSPGSGLPGLMRSLATSAGVPATVLPMGIPAASNTLGTALAVGGGTGVIGGAAAEATGSPVVGSIASMIAPVLPAAVASGATHPSLLFTQAGRERNVGEMLRKNIDQPEAAVDMLRQAPEAPFPRSPDFPDAPVGPTTAQVLAQGGDKRMMGIERALSQGPTTEGNAVNNRYAANDAARKAQMERMVPNPVGGGAHTVQTAIEAEVARQLAVIEADRAKATADRVPVRDAAMAAAETARDATGKPITDGEAGGVFGGAYDTAYQQQKGVTRQMFEADSLKGEIKGLPLDVKAISDTIDQYYAGLQKSTPPEVRKALGQIDEAVQANATVKPGASSIAAGPSEAASGIDGMPAQAAKDKPGNLLDENLNAVLQQASPTLTYAQMRTLESSIGEAANKARVAGDAQTSAVLTQFKQAIRKSMQDGMESGAVSEQARTDYRDAMAMRRHQGETYESGAVKQLGRERDGERAIKDESIPKAMFQQGGAAFDSFRRAIGKEPGVAETAQDWLAAQWRKAVHKPDGGLKGTWRDASSKFLTDHADVLKEYPGLQQRLSDAVSKSKNAEDLAARFDAEIKAADKAAAEKSGSLQTETGARFFLKSIDPEKAFVSFLNSGKRLRDGRFILQLAKRDPDFRRGVNAAIRDHILGMKNDAQRISFIDEPANRKLMTALFGDKMLAQWDKVAADATRDRLRDTANPARGSDTNPKEQAMEAIGKAAGASNKLTSFIKTLGEAVGGKARDELRAKALVDPKTAADLLEKANSRPTFGGRVKTGAGRAAAGNEDKRRR